MNRREPDNLRSSSLIGFLAVEAFRAGIEAEYWQEIRRQMAQITAGQGEKDITVGMTPHTDESDYLLKEPTE